MDFEKYKKMDFVSAKSFPTSGVFLLKTPPLMTERGLEVHCSLCFAKQIPSESGLTHPTLLLA